MSQISQEPQHATTTQHAMSTRRSDEKSTARSRASRPGPAPTPSAFRGWARFGAVVMLTMGLFWALLGLIALLDDSYLTRDPDELLAFQSLTAWGWAHLLGGLLALVAGARILWDGNRWARAGGIFVAWLSAIVNISFLHVAPLWATVIIALDLVVIYALTVHGAELERPTGGRRTVR